MSEHDDDRDLDAFLNRQSPVSQAWREAVAEQRAPELLDAAILAAAAEARPVPKPKTLPRLRRWRLPIGLAASLVIGIGVLREAQRDELAREQLLGELAAVTASVAMSQAAPSPQRAELSVSDDRDQHSKRAAEVEAESRLDAAAPADPVPVPPRALAPPPPPPPPEAPDPPKMRTVPAPVPDGQPYPFPAAPAEALRAPASAAPSSAERSAPTAKPDPQTSQHWQPASYRDLRLGVATVDEVLRRFEVPEVDSATRSNDALLPEGRQAHRLLDYGRKLDPRGRLRLYFDGDSEVLASANLVLEPALSLAAVQESEGLIGSGIARAAEAPPCDAQLTAPVDPKWPRFQNWPAQGVQLLLAGPDRVIEINWLARCH